MAKNNYGAYNIEDLRQLAKKRVPKGVFDYVNGGAEDGIAVQNNRDAYTQLKIKNRVLIDVSKRSTETTIFGKKIAMPYGISPTGTAGLMWFGGEAGLAIAAEKMGVPCTVALNAQTSMEEIREAAPNADLWFQVYTWPDKDLSLKQIERIKSVGFETLIVTVDGPVGSNREYNHKNGFSMPLKYSPRLFAQLLARPGWLVRVLGQHYLKRGAPTMVNYPEELMSKITDPMLKHMFTKVDNVTWEHIHRIRDVFPGNLLIKGLQSKEDAVLAKENGLQGVIMSNHGGRYVDCAPAPLQVVGETREAVGDDFTVIIDSGARRGSDLVKAIACGANMVMSGRPTLFGAAVAGTHGSYRALEIFKVEMDRVMAQLGLNSVDEIGPEIFWNPPEWVRKPKTQLKAAAE
ncbi:MAG: alpha-hydroxy acid oxidase [Rhodospirillales bacterium]|jgi:isopentenyl diphosphate isomerase/L-lactate dehydrogenase-like FMN-dependent dehydrogenase